MALTHTPTVERVLVVSPPHVPSYFNAGHHLPLFMTASYLRSAKQLDVTAIDGGALALSWKDIADILFRQFDLVVIINDFDGMEGFARLVEYTRALSPGARIITCGRLSSTVPHLFRRYECDAVIESGDYESGVALFAEALKAKQGDERLPGVAVKQGRLWMEPSDTGRFLASEEWVLPDISEVPYEAYDRLYQRDENRFCGIPRRRELVVPIARGCPLHCHFCEVPGREGGRERRISVGRAIDYIERSFERSPFEYVAMYAPTFTLDQPWVERLCETIGAATHRTFWKCTTTLKHLNRELLRKMADSGCVRVSVGLEVLSATAYRSLPLLKRTTLDEFRELAQHCNNLSIELNCFVMFGLPGATASDIRFTVDEVQRNGARLRPTIYTPYHLLRADMDERTVASFNRQLCGPDVPAEIAMEWYRYYFGSQQTSVDVSERIPTRRA